MILCVMQEQCLISISDGPPAIPQIKAGKVRALAVTGAERSPELPDVPSMAEAGYPGGQHQAVVAASSRRPRPRRRSPTKLEAALRSARSPIRA